MITSLSKIIQKRERQRDRVREAVTIATNKENLAHNTVEVFRDEKRTLTRQLQITRERIYTDNCINLESFHLTRNHCTHLSKLVGASETKIADATQLLAKCRAERQGLSTTYTRIVNRLKQLEIRVDKLHKIRQTRLTAVSEEEAHENWQVVRESTEASGTA